MKVDTLKFDFIDILDFNERPFKKAFCPSVFFKELDQHRDYDALKKYLRKFKVKLSKEFVTVSGEFDGDNNRILISIYDNYESFGGQYWIYFKFELIQTIMHELVHWSQYSMRDEGYIEHDDYYSHPAEIHAYAHRIFLEEQFPQFNQYSTKDLIFSEVDAKTQRKYTKWIEYWKRLYLQIQSFQMINR